MPFSGPQRGWVCLWLAFFELIVGGGFGFGALEVTVLKRKLRETAIE
jgi:hypothetical protein